MKKVLLAVLLTVVLTVPAFSQMRDMPMRYYGDGRGQMMGMCGMDRMCDRMGMCIAHAEYLGLTDDQLAKMKPLHREMEKKQARFIADLKIAKVELMEIMDVKDFDITKANTAAKKIGDLKTAHQLEMLKAMKEMRAILTDEQFKKMQKMMPMKMDGKKPAKRTMKK